MAFKIGDKAMVPNQGVGIIKDIERFDLDETTVEMYLIKILHTGSTFRVPLDKVEAQRVREIFDAEAIPGIYDVLSDRTHPVDKTTWNRRNRQYMEKIRTNDPLEVAAVLRDLAILRSEKTLSFGERKMYDLAHGLIVQELAVAQDVDEDKVKKDLDDLFAKADAKAARKAKRAAKKKAAKAEPADDQDDED